MMLPEAPWKYFFKTPGAILVPLSSLKTTRARPKGIANAEPHMQRAYDGEGKRRKPISIRDIGGGKYEVVDGNSTTAIARKNGWKKIPAEVVKEEGRTVWEESADLLERVRGKLEEEEKTPLQPNDIKVGMMIGDSWKVSKKTAKSVRIFMPGSDRLGAKFAGKGYTFRWDGTGFKRQGQYLYADEIKKP